MKFTLEIESGAYANDKDLRRYIEALQLITNRMSVSHYKYGPLGDKFPHSMKSIVQMEAREQAYHATMNTEHMLDAANYALIEFLFPSYKDAYFKALESHESPKVIWGGTDDEHS